MLLFWYTETWLEIADGFPSSCTIFLTSHLNEIAALSKLLKSRKKSFSLAYAGCQTGTFFFLLIRVGLSE